MEHVLTKYYIMICWHLMVLDDQQTHCYLQFYVAIHDFAHIVSGQVTLFKVAE